MNSKLVIMGLMISALLAVSVSGQKQKMFQQVLLQDDASGDHMVFVIADGEYKFESCKENSAISGVGSISITGCTFVLEDISDTRRVLAEVDLCAKVGKASVAFEDDSSTSEKGAHAFETVLSDSNTTDSAFGCEPNRFEPK